MKKTSIFLAMLIASAACHADRGTTARVATANAEGSTRAAACQNALELARLTSGLPSLEAFNKVERMEKKCECGEETSRTGVKSWSCMGMISYAEKK
ncbi:MAG: hypothetical protein QM772_15215 [Ottowia sp.]|uniref:hypothetical protein n=1 Tax=Ottowia sp. TaxID=1898956 RepID=UPI0039E6DC74